MDDLHYQHPLNVAHMHARSAEQYENIGKFQDAFNKHQLAAGYIEKAISLCTYSKVRKSLNIQKEDHIRRMRIVRLKEKQRDIRERFAIHQMYQTKLMALEQGKYQAILESDNKDLEWAILRNIETADSLLHALTHDENEDVNNVSEISNSNPLSVVFEGTKHPKNETVVIEELHTLNCQLKNLISQLLVELDESHREIQLLRHKIDEYEKKENNDKNDKNEGKSRQSALFEVEKTAQDNISEQNNNIIRILDSNSDDKE